MTESNNQQEDIKPTQHVEEGNSSLKKIVAILESISSSTNPKQVTTRHTILIILLCVIVYFIYQLAHYFINTILFAFLSGVAYYKLRERFVNFWKKQNRPKIIYNFQFFTEIFLFLFLFLLLPWISQLCSGSISQHIFQLNTIAGSFRRVSNPLIRIIQISLFLTILYNLLRNKLHRFIFITDMNERTIKILNIILGILVFIVLIFIIGLFITTIAIELRNAAVFVKKTIESNYNCSFFGATANNSTILQCKDSIPQTYKHLMPQIQSQTLNQCVESIYKLQTQYLGFNFTFFEQNLCMGISIVNKVNPALLRYFSKKSTNIFFGLFSGIFGVIFNIVAFISDKIFEFTTFTSIFLATVANYYTKNQPFHIFGEASSRLVNQITFIIQATIFIALQHLFFSIVLLQIFHFSSINILLSIFLSLIAFIPYVRPSFIMILITIINIQVRKSLVPSILCAVLYWIISDWIYNRHYSGVSLHKVVINLSVVFGIYEFGFFGIFYGPLLLILFQYVYEQLLK